MIHRTLSFITSVAESTGALFALLIAGQSVFLPQTAATKLSARLDDYLATIVRPTEAERRNLLAGQPIAKVSTAIQTPRSQYSGPFGSRPNPWICRSNAQY